MCLFHVHDIISIQIKFDIDINYDELLETMWEHNNRKKKNGSLLVECNNAKPKFRNVRWCDHNCMLSDFWLLFSAKKIILLIYIYNHSIWKKIIFFNYYHCWSVQCRKSMYRSIFEVNDLDTNKIKSSKAWIAMQKKALWQPILTRKIIRIVFECTSNYSYHLHSLPIIIFPKIMQFFQK
jgi:hypothetical protein